MRKRRAGRQQHAGDDDVEDEEGFERRVGATHQPQGDGQPDEIRCDGEVKDLFEKRDCGRRVLVGVAIAADGEIGHRIAQEECCREKRKGAHTQVGDAYHAGGKQGAQHNQDRDGKAYEHQNV
jgi:hypothetical protein